jgi:phosphate transport system protein
MRIHLQREIDKIKKLLLTMSAVVEEELREAVRAVEDRDGKAAEAVLRRERQTDVLEVDIEEECLKVLALYQPVAVDLRFIVSVLKINSDLERIGDLAAHIAERAVCLCRQPEYGISFRLGEMADAAQKMLGSALDALVHLDAAGARAVCAADDVVDEIHRENIRLVKLAIMHNPTLFETLLQVMHISRHIERIADHATNIAEDLIYLIEGEIVRHSLEPADRARDLVLEQHL